MEIKFNMEDATLYIPRGRMANLKPMPTEDIVLPNLHSIISNISMEYKTPSSTKLISSSIEHLKDAQCISNLAKSELQKAARNLACPLMLEGFVENAISTLDMTTIQEKKKKLAKLQLINGA